MILHATAHLNTGRGLEALGPAGVRLLTVGPPYFRATAQLLAQIALWKRTGQTQAMPLTGLPGDSPEAVLATRMFEFVATGNLTESPVKLVGDLRLPIDTVTHASTVLKNIGLVDEAERLEGLWGTIEQLLRNSGETLVLAPMFFENIGHMVLAGAMMEGQRMGLFQPRRTAGRAETPHNPYLFDLLSRQIDPMPAQVRFGEILNTAKVFMLADGQRMQMMELVSRAAEVWAEGRRPLLQVDDEVIERGWDALARFGVERGSRFVTLHIREPGFHAHTHRTRINEAELNAIRNAPLDSYTGAVERVIGSGGTVVRLGNPGMTELGHRPGFVDYPFTDMRSDWMDIFLASQCHYHIGSASGMSFVPMLFGRAVLFTNYVTLSSIIDAPSVVTLFKPLQDRTGTPVTFAEHAERYRFIQTDIELAFHGLVHAYNDAADVEEGVELMERYVDHETGLLRAPDDTFRAARETFVASPVARRPNIPPGFWKRHYAPTGG